MGYKQANFLLFWRRESFSPENIPPEAWADTLQIAAMQLEKPKKRRHAATSGAVPESTSTATSAASLAASSAEYCGWLGHPGCRAIRVLAMAGLQTVYIGCIQCSLGAHICQKHSRLFP